jgi:drug/metabolite transporter (DMT)-like permease
MARTGEELAAVAVGAPPTAPRRAPVLASFAAIYLVWGSTFLAIRWAVETIPPFSMMAARCLVGGAILLAIGLLREGRVAWPTRREWGGAAVVGTLFFVVCHGVLAYAEQTAPSGVSALFLATIPLYVPLLAWWLAGDRRPSLRLTLSLVAGFAGVALLVAAQGSGGVSLGDAALLLLSAFGWAAGTVATRLVPVPRSPLLGAATPLIAGGIILVAIALATGEHTGHVSARSVVGLGYLILFGTVATFSAYIWLLRVVNPTRVATYAFVNPAVAVLLGWAVAGETFGAWAILATAVIVGAVAFAVTERGGRDAASAPASTR